MLVSIHLVAHATGEIIFQKYYGRRLGAVRAESRKPGASEWLKRLGEKRLENTRAEYLKRLRDSTTSYRRIWVALKMDGAEQVTTFEYPGTGSMDISSYTVQVICKAIGNNDTVLLLCGTEDNNATLLFPVANAIDKMVRDTCKINIPTTSTRTSSAGTTTAPSMTSAAPITRGTTDNGATRESLSAESRICMNHSKLLAVIDARFGDGKIDIVPFVLSIGNTIHSN